MATETVNKELPAWITDLDGEGVTVQLSVAASINGVEVDSLRLRSPTLAEVRKVQKMNKGDPDAVELQLFASLSDAPPADIAALKLKDYNRVNIAYFRMVEED